MTTNVEENFPSDKPWFVKGNISRAVRDQANVVDSLQFNQRYSATGGFINNPYLTIRLSSHQLRLRIDGRQIQQSEK